MSKGFSKDADHAGCLDTRKITSGGIQFLGDKLVSWMSKKQNCTAMSSRCAQFFLEFLAVDSESNPSRFSIDFVKSRRKNAKPGPTLDDSTFDDLDADHEVLEKRGCNEELVSATSNTGVSTTVLEVSTATPMTPPNTTSVFEDKDIFLADALVMLSDKTKLKGVAIKETHRSKEKGVLKESPVKDKLRESDLDVLDCLDSDVARLVYEEELAELEKEKEER
ncbi:hypothetical protein Tco_1530577 [Tanacetum coccineum]